MTTSFKKVTMSTAEICAGLALTPQALALVGSQATAEAALGVLVAEGLWADAVRFLARGLPKREAVWWACLCARETLPADAPAPVAAALAAAEAWVYKPTEELRRAAMASAEAAKLDTPSSWAAVGAFWSGGSMSPPGNPVVPPAEDLTGQAVAGSIMLAAVLREPQKAEEKYRRFLGFGANIANGGSGREQARA